MKAILFTTLLLVGAIAAQRAPNRRREEKIVDEDEEDLHTPLNQRRPRYTPQGYAINYNLGCTTRTCYCAQICVPWTPCNCACPPPCPPETTTTPRPENRCDNGAPDHAYPDCCFNGGHGEFCCRNGAENLYCCLNGAKNPWCDELPEPPIKEDPITPAPPGGNDCNQCRCQPCIPWMPCPPCPCRQMCGK